MHIHRLAAAWPLHLHIVVFAEGSHIVAQLRPSPALLNRLIGHAQPAIALPASGDEKVALTRRSPQALGAVPTIEQDVRDGSRHRLERSDQRFHLLDLALESHVFPCTDGFLSIQLWSQRTASAQQDREPLYQTMPNDALVLGGRVVFAQSFHLAAFRLGHRRVISNHIPGHQGLLGTASTLGPLALLTVPLGFDGQLHLFAEVCQPACHQLLLRPRGLRQKPTRGRPDSPALPPLATVSRAFVVLHTASAPAARSRSTGIGAWRSVRRTARQSGSTRHPGI